MRDEYMTLKSGVEVVGEFEDRRSKFIAQISRVSSESEAQRTIDAIRLRHHDARHNVPVWILSDGTEHCSDDGEPSHTAGAPTLAVLRGANMADVCCVVTRYFGGTLLGPGGLKRAYAAATQAALLAAEKEESIVRVGMCTHVSCAIPYAVYGKVERLVHDCAGNVVESAFAENVRITARFKAGAEARFVATMKEIMAGEEVCGVSEPAYCEL